MTRKARTVTLPDGTVVPDRRAHKRRRFVEMLAGEPIASLAFGLMLSIIAGGVVFSSLRDAKASEDSKQQSIIAAENSEAANINAQAAKDLAGTIDRAVDLLTRVGAVSRQSTYDTHTALRDTTVCLVRVLANTVPGEFDRRNAEIDACVQPLTPPPNPDGSPGTRPTTTPTTEEHGG